MFKENKSIMYFIVSLKSLLVCNPFYAGNPQTGTFINSESPNEMPHNATFH